MANQNGLRAKLEALKAAGITTIDDLIDLVESLEKFPMQESASTTIYDEHEMEMRVKKILHRLGGPSNVRGYQYTTEAIMIVIKDYKKMNEMVRSVYPCVAKKFNATVVSAERCIRHFIEKIYERGNLEYINEVFGNSIDSEKGKATNSEFIATIADYVLMGGN